MQKEAGLTLVELIVVVAIGLLAMTFAAIFSLPGLARQSMRGAVFDVQSCIQLARIESVSRNVQCACVIDAAAGRLDVFDTKGTAAEADDERLHERDLPATVIFARPDVGPPITLPQIGASQRYVALFFSDGSLSSSQGEVHLFGGDRFGRVSLFGAGGTRISSWRNNAWSVGS